MALLLPDTFFLAILFWFGIYCILIAIASGVWACFRRLGKILTHVRQIRRA